VDTLYNEVVGASIRDNKKIALKLHKQFGHPSTEKLVKLVRDAGMEDSSLEKCIADVVRDCEVCCRYKKPRPSPVVSIPLATKFNELVALDLKACGKVHFLVMVDHATRFCAAVVINNKKAETIVKGIFLAWVSIFGAPKKIFSDNGGEFNNSDMRELGEQFNVKVMTTAAESPWSNGVCERLNAVLGSSVRKIQEDTKCSTEVALAWAVSARNALSNFSGYSPNQLVFGRNPVFPNVSEGNPPALDEPEVSEIVKENLCAMHSAREDFIRKESDERIKRALRHNVRESFFEDIQTGSEVFYKRADSHKWHGPGIVIGRDGKQVLVKHGGVYVRVHSCRLNRAPDTAFKRAEQHPSQEEDSDDFQNMPLNVAVQRPVVRRHQEEEESVSRHHVSESNNPSEPAETPASDEEPPAPAESGGEPVEESNSSEQPTQSSSQRSAAKPRIGLRVQGICSTSGEYLSGKIVGRAGKATGKYKNCFNVKNDADGHINWVDFDKDFDTHNLNKPEATLKHI